MDREDEDRLVLARYARGRLLRERQAFGRGYQADMARRSGLSQPHLANLMNRDHMGLGLDAAAALGRAWGMTVAEMLQVARGDEPAAVLPNLERAIAIASAREPLPEHVVAVARRIGSSARDFSVALWSIVLAELAAELANAQPDGTSRRAGR